MSTPAADWIVDAFGRRVAVIAGREYRVRPGEYRWVLEGHLEDPHEGEAVPSAGKGKQLAEHLAAHPEHFPQGH
ncbi:hypothetical protein [Amycolatopsis sp. NPDC004079]|uniref:hypothetical protein n=1 Tax=Amycolatopsis sp. NPDC004079 TaxID=3154549 RepID=UPI0033AEC0B2